MSGLKVNYKLYWVVITMLMQYVTITLFTKAIGKTRNYGNPPRNSGRAFNSREEFYCSNNKLYKYKVLRCMVAQV